MREFSTYIREALVNGLLPNESFRDTRFFKDLYNLVPYEDSLRPYEPTTDMLGDLERKSNYPFPQWFKFENIDILIHDARVMRLNTDYEPFDITKIEAPDNVPFKLTEQLRGVDYGGDWILLNRDGCVYSHNGNIGFSDELKAASIVKQNNRTLIGGSTHGMWTPRWKRKIRDLGSTARLSLKKFSTSLPPNFVLWSSFDSIDFPFALLFPDIVLDSLGEDSLFEDQLYANEFGFMEMPYKGAVLDMHAGLEQVFVFQEDGLCAIAPNTNAPGSTYAVVGKQPIGLKRRGAVGGDEDSLVFIDEHDQLWYISQQGMQQLDYKRYMKELVGEIFITKDIEQESFYIGDQYTSFMLNDLKLTRCHQTVISQYSGFNKKAGVVYETGDTKASLRTEHLDLGNPVLKTLTGVFVVLDKEAKGYVQPYANVNGKTVASKNVVMNPEGYAATRLFGKNHEIEIVFNDYNEVFLDAIELKWQIDDKRQTRGVFITQDASGAG